MQGPRFARGSALRVLAENVRILPATGGAVEELRRPDWFAAELQTALDTGAKTISLIGGEPTLHPHTILATAAAARR